jgi:hypothetical protein
MNLRDITLQNILAYNIGWFRYNLYYSKHFKFLIRKHILEQIDVRIESMRAECFYSGSCIMCGCTTTALQMANKACEGDCYPKMMSRRKWKALKSDGYVLAKDKNDNKIIWELENNKFKIFR